MTRNSIRCPACNCGDCRVTHTMTKEVAWQGRTRTYIKRRRVCRYCGLPFMTREDYEHDHGPDTTLPSREDAPDPTTRLPPKKKNPFL